MKKKSGGALATELTEKIHPLATIGSNTINNSNSSSIKSQSRLLQRQKIRRSRAISQLDTYRISNPDPKITRPRATKKGTPTSAIVVNQPAVVTPFKRAPPPLHNSSVPAVPIVSAPRFTANVTPGAMSVVVRKQPKVFCTAVVVKPTVKFIGDIEILNFQGSPRLIGQRFTAEIAQNYLKQVATQVAIVN